MHGEKHNRRTFLKSNAAALGALGIPAVTGHAQDAPNVVFIICDQMRGDAMGCMGNPNARTPHLDRLAKQGVLFPRGFSNNPVCVPSRMATFAGRYPHQTGRLSNRSWDAKELCVEGTLAGYFLRRGYRTGWIGKNHTYQGEEFKKFDTASLRARERFRKYSRFVPPHWHSDTFLPAELCNPRKNTDEAIQFIQKAKQNEPFFLHVSYFDPHPPYMAPAEFSSRYCSESIKLPRFVPPKNLSRRLANYAECMHLDELSEADLRETLRYYHASVEWGVDHQVGRIMNTLQTQGLLENTIVVFTSDHGDFMCDYHMVRKGMFLYDSLLHVPFIWHAPGRIMEGDRVDNLAQGIDIFPTLIELTGGTVPEHLEGRSLRDNLRGQSGDLAGEALFTTAAYGVVEPVNNPAVDLKDPDETPLHTRVMEQGMEPKYSTMMIRTHKYKYIMNENDPPELYDVNGDVHEMKNVAEKGAHAAERTQLEKRLKTWRKKTT
ncbi:sulfatase-like hydrolase/transferase [bacterium]|nr:sulfatase-like hydrolase/transferase [bacterium]